VFVCTASSKMKFTNITGLSSKEVEEARKRYGTNELPPAEIESIWDKLKENFEDPLIRILLVALGITCVLAFFGYAGMCDLFNSTH
jgi:Ca2+-transporting ATPase